MPKKVLAMMFVAGLAVGVFGARADACTASRKGNEPIHLPNAATGGYIYANGSASCGYVGVSSTDNKTYAEIKVGTDGTAFFHGASAQTGGGAAGVEKGAPKTDC